MRMFILALGFSVAGQAALAADAWLQHLPSEQRRATSVHSVAWGADRLFAWAEEPIGTNEPKAADEEPKLNYGPPVDEPRMTLFQWSYGTSFSGGPPKDDDLQTDRPDFVEASTTVGKGVLQIESGYTYSRKDSDGTASHSAGEFLFRYGVFAEWFEFRLGVFPFAQTVSAPNPNARHSGVEDLYLGAKIGLTPQEGWWPEMCITPQMTVPTGHNAVTSGSTLPGVNWLYGWDVTDEIGIGMSTQFNSAIDGVTNSKYTEWSQAITINRNLTEKVGSYVEWIGLFPSGADTELAQHYMDGGFTYRPNPDMQFDVRAGVGLSDASDDYFVGTGFSIRIK